MANSKKMKNSVATGGRAEATGGNYETLVATWYCVRVLAGAAGEPPAGLPTGTRLVSLRCQTEAHVDDVLITTSSNGFLFIQAKRSIDLSAAETSLLASVLDQFIRQYKACEEGSTSDQWARPLDRDRDRLILATLGRSSTKITEVLPRLLRGVRERADAELLSDVQTSARDREVAGVVEAHIRRIWQITYGAEPSRADTGRLLRLMRVQVLDVEPEGRDRTQALDLLRGTVLEEPDTAATAWSAMVEFCGQLRGESSGAHGPSLQNLLIGAGVAIRAAPDYRADTRALQAWTQLRLARIDRFTRLIESRPETTIQRSVSGPLRAAAEAGSLLIVGEPGAGKSGVCYRLAQDLSDAGRNVVFLPVDVLNVDTLGGLNAELRISHSFAEVIQNWPGRDPGILIIDALDAARKPETQTLLRMVVEELKETASDRWRIVASVRRYDLRQGTEWARIFRGMPPLEENIEKEFRYLSHVGIKTLSQEELSQLAASYPELNELFQRAPTKLRELLLNIFNLHLLAELLNDGVVSTDLENIRTQPELLDAYWRHRVQGSDGRRDAREGILSGVVEGMIANRSLQVARADLRGDPNISVLNDLERQGVLVASEGDGRPDDDILLFSHNILFDYVVARLVFRRGRDPVYLATRLRDTPDLALLLGPSLTFAMADRWGVQATTRQEFWNLAFALEAEATIPEIARLQAPMVIAEDQSVGLADLEPLLSALGTSKTPTAAEGFLRHLIGALFVISISGRALVGPGAGPWSALCERLTQFERDEIILSTSPLLSKLTEQVDHATAEELGSLGAAARNLLVHTWARQPRLSRLIAAALHALCLTIRSDIRATGKLLRRSLVREHMEQFAHQELRQIARNIGRIIDADPELASDIYAAAFSFDEKSDAPTDISGSQLLALRSNRRQDYQGSWYELTENFPKFLDAAPETAAQALNRAMEGYVERERSSNRTTEQRTVEFNYRDRTASYTADNSYIWLQTALGSRQDAPQLLLKLAAKLQNDAGAAQNHFLRVVSALIADARLAVIWRTVLDLASQKPTVLAHEVVPLVCAAPVLTGLDTREVAGRFISAAYPHLSQDERVEIETAIVGLEGNEGERAKKILLGCIPNDLFVTADGRAKYEGLHAAAEIQENRPPLQITSGSREFDLDLLWQTQGVPIEEPANRRLREIIDPVEKFWKEHLNNPPNESVAQAIIPDLEGLYSAVSGQEHTSAHESVIEHAFGLLAEAANIIANLEVDTIKKICAWDLIVQILLATAKAPWPELSAEFEEQFNSNVSWGGPCARIAAAQGLMKLLKMADQPDRAPLQDAVLAIARDDVARVRYQVACRLNTLWNVDPNLVWDEITRFILEDGNRGVIGGALGSLTCIAVTDLDRATDLAVELLYRFPPSDARAGVAACRENCISLLSDLSIHLGHAPSKAEIDRLVQTPVENSHMLRVLLARTSDALTAGAPGRPDDPENARRARVLGFYEDVLTAATSRLDEIFALRDVNQFDKWEEADKELVRSQYGILDEMTIRLFFASGAHPSGSDITTAQLRLFEEARGFFEKLADCLVPSIAHHLIETLERYIDVAPGDVFALIARAVRAAERGGYALESMAQDLIVRIVERYLADHSEVFECADRRRDLMSCLDIFVRAGWPAAQALTFRIPEIWR